MEWGPCYLKTASLSSNEDANTTVHINSLVVVPAIVEEEDRIYKVNAATAVACYGSTNSREIPFLS